ncbi:MAG: response regulator transcription factor [Flavobacteriaceae bacterium]|jgi:DNA-binding NarL/FixJ family response regulator|nr:response regulator transcription factor [Flavobacteriaceae bacterium]
MEKNVIIIDKQDITRIGIEILVRQNEAGAVLSYTNNKGSLISFLTTHDDAFVILDYTLCDFNSVDELLNISARFPKVRWLLFSDELSIDFLKKVIFNSRVFSVVLKTSSIGEINTSLSLAFQNERFICSNVTNLLLMNNKEIKIDNTLTSTEKEILREMALGRTTKEIAALRNLSFHTVTTHRKNIFRKLEINNAHEATRYAIRAGIIDVSDYYI